MVNPQAGDTYRFAFDIGTEPGIIRAGTVATVAEVVAADTPGAGDDTEESYVLEWREKQPVLVDDEPRVVEQSRRWAATADAFTGLLVKETK